MILTAICLALHPEEPVLGDPSLASAVYSSQYHIFHGGVIHRIDQRVTELLCLTGALPTA